jgi:hypothetical protein
VGHIQGIFVVILVDSGSSHSFINDSVAPFLKNVSIVANPIKVQVANGELISCSSEFKQATWVIQGQEFVSNLKIIPLPYYDMILGIDWLESHIPVKIDWLNKWMVINVNGDQLHLYGIHHPLPVYSLVKLHVTSDQQSAPKKIQLPPQVRQLLVAFNDLFDEPQSLLPSRSCVHIIPLKPGAQPINIRPFKFSPTMKNEMEKQVQDMLN